MLSKSQQRRIACQTGASDQRWRLMSDDDGHYYLVPVGQEKAFDAWVESFQTNDNADPDYYEDLGCRSLGCSPTCLSFTDPKAD